MNMIETWLLQGVEEAIPKIRMLAGDRISMHEPKLRLSSISGLSEFFGGEDKVICAIGMRLMDNSPLRLLMVMDHEVRSKIALAVTGGKLGSVDQKMAVSVLMEMGNIFGSSVANCLSRYLGMPIKTSIPEAAEDMAGAVISSILGSAEDLDDEVYVLETSVCIDNTPSKCTFFLLSSPSLHERLSKLIG